MSYGRRQCFALLGSSTARSRCGTPAWFFALLGSSAVYAAAELLLRSLHHWGVSPIFGREAPQVSYAIRDGRSLQESQAEQRLLSPWRRDGDSNPEGVAALPLFESGSLPFGHPSTSSMVGPCQERRKRRATCVADSRAKSAKKHGSL
jgi:hypothetical protein